LPNVGPYIYDVSISGFTRSSIYIYDISSLRVNEHHDDERKYYCIYFAALLEVTNFSQDRAFVG